MGAIVKACNTKNSVKNTGKECDTALVALAMLMAIKRSEKFTEGDLADPYTLFKILIHQRKAFPLFGQAAPIRSITNEAENDITVTLDDGLKVFVRYGLYNRTLATTSGGLCYAQALQSFLNSGYSLIEIDQQAQIQFRKNADKTFSGLYTDFMYSPAPLLADFQNPFKNRFQYSMSPIEIVNNAVIYKGAEDILSMTGLLDIAIEQAAGVPATTTGVTVTVETECAGTDLIDEFPVDLPDPTNFVITNKATGANISISAATIVGGNIRLAATLVSGQSYYVTGSDPTIWLANNIEFYDAAFQKVEFLVP